MLCHCFSFVESTIEIKLFRKNQVHCSFLPFIRKNHFFFSKFNFFVYIAVFRLASTINFRFQWPFITLSPIKNSLICFSSCRIITDNAGE